MNEFEELKEWYEKADSLVCSMGHDKLYNIMMIAVVLRDLYIQGKSDSVKERGSAPR